MLGVSAFASCRSPRKREVDEVGSVAEQRQHGFDAAPVDARCAEDWQRVRALLSPGFDQVVLETCLGFGFPDQEYRFRVVARQNENDPWVEVVDKGWEEDAAPLAAATRLADGRLAVVFSMSPGNDLCVIDDDTHGWVCADILDLLPPPDETERFGAALEWVAALAPDQSVLGSVTRHVLREYEQRSPRPAATR